MVWLSNGIEVDLTFGSLALLMYYITQQIASVLHAKLDKLMREGGRIIACPQLDVDMLRRCFM